MSFEQRERKRKAKAAIQAAKTTAHKSGSASAGWYLTYAASPCTCNNPRCQRHFRRSTKARPQEIVFRKVPETIFCVDCANVQGIKWKTSRAWEDPRLLRRP
jgi:hypothetical protein